MVVIGGGHAGLEAAWAAVRDGTVYCIGSDHAPHSRAAKERPWPATAAGLLGEQAWEWRPSLAVFAAWTARWWPDVDGVFVEGSPVLDWVADDGRRRGDDAPVLVAPPGVKKNQHLRSDAVQKGAKVAFGSVDDDTTKTKETSAHRLRPIIISDVQKEMEIYYTESFGPSVSLIAVDCDEDAIAIANDTEYGLSGAVFTENLGRGLKIAKEIESGAVHINSMTVQ